VPQNGLAGPEEVNPEEMGFTLQEGRLLHISSSVDMENLVTIGCAGAILTYLQRRRAVAPTPLGETAEYRVRALQMFNLRDTMWINSSTLTSLQIIQSESHPNMFNQGPGKKSASGKEGLSVYGLFQHFAYTPQGRAKLKQSFFRPTVDLNTIRERHDFIGVFSRPDNLAALEKVVKALKHIKNLRPVMVNLRKGISTGSAKITGFKTTVWASLLAVRMPLLHTSAIDGGYSADNMNSLRSTPLTFKTRYKRSRGPTTYLYAPRFIPLLHHKIFY
jgi:DNA mismatch repair protein MSH5